MTTAQDQQSREAYEDGKWYWVEREGWYGEPPTISPACYKAECDAWYSYIFSGISTPYLKVLEPCEMRAARALPAGDPVGWIDMAAWPPIRWPAGMVRADFRPLDGMALHTAAQVQAMGRVPDSLKARCAEILDWHKTGLLSGDALREFAAAKYPEHHDALQMAERETAKEAFSLLAAAPQPAAQERKPLTINEIAGALQRAGIETQHNTGISGRVRWTTCGSMDPVKITRAIEAAHGIKATP